MVLVVQEKDTWNFVFAVVKLLSLFMYLKSFLFSEGIEREHGKGLEINRKTKSCRLFANIEMFVGYFVNFKVISFFNNIFNFGVLYSLVQNKKKVPTILVKNWIFCCTPQPYQDSSLLIFHISVFPYLKSTSVLFFSTTQRCQLAKASDKCRHKCHIY